MQAKVRYYRQHDDLYDLIGRMAEDLGISRAMVVKLAVLDYADRLEVDREAVVREARDANDEMMGDRREAMVQGLVRAGIISAPDPVPLDPDPRDHDNGYGTFSRSPR